MEIKAMRDVFLQVLYEKMAFDESIFFVVADFGSPVLDKIKTDYPNRFINVGIAEQNLINVATGLALEGFSVYAYAIAPFITMRCFEQIRVNVAILSTVREINLNLVGVGAGVSYAMSGPTHHCLEDLSIIKALPNIEFFSPSDCILVEAYVERTLMIKKPKYIRLDAKPVASLGIVGEFESGFRVLREGCRTAIISTGYMTQKAFEIVQVFDIKLIDLYFLNTYNYKKLAQALEGIETIITLEEGFQNSGGLDGEINFYFKDKKVINIGFDKKYTFAVGSREFVHSKSGVGISDIIHAIEKAF